MVNIRSLKAFVRKNFKNSLLREAILEKEDNLSINEFLDEVKVWLKLLELEDRKNSRNDTRVTS